MLLGLTACSEKPKRAAVYVDVESDSILSTEQLEEKTAVMSNEVIVPYTEQGGVKIVPVKLNGVGLDMIFDTGCSGISISLAEAKYMYAKGLITDDDILGSVSTRIADGSIADNVVVRLKELVIDDQLRCVDVNAIVSNSLNAPLLLGNGVLDRVKSITIDNQNKTLRFILTNDEFVD